MFHDVLCAGALFIFFCNILTRPLTRHEVIQTLFQPEQKHSIVKFKVFAHLRFYSSDVFCQQLFRVDPRFNFRFQQLAKTLTVSICPLGGEINRPTKRYQFPFAITSSCFYGFANKSVSCPETPAADETCRLWPGGLSCIDCAPYL